jgi:hypothetical protein
MARRRRYEDDDADDRPRRRRRDDDRDYDDEDIRPRRRREPSGHHPLMWGVWIGLGLMGAAVVAGVLFLVVAVVCAGVGSGIAAKHIDDAPGQRKAK